MGYVLRRRNFFQLNTKLTFIQGPHAIRNRGFIEREVQFIKNSVAFNAISAYQNRKCRIYLCIRLIIIVDVDLYQQFAPRGYANAGLQIDQLVHRHLVFPAFDRSVFTTSEISFGDSEPTLSHKNYNGGLDNMEVITSFGTYDHTKGGHIIFWEDDKVIELRSGGSVMWPAGSKRFSFVPVSGNEERFLLRQFCHAGILHWVEKGRRSDIEFEDAATPEVLAAWDEKRGKRGKASAKMFTKLGDIYVF